jgi:hypothetical protein
MIFRVSTWEPSGAFSRPEVSLDVRRGTKGLSIRPRCDGAGFYLDHTQLESISLTHRPPLPPGMFPVLIFTRGRVNARAMEWSKGDMSLKNPVTPPGIDPGTVP